MSYIDNRNTAPFGAITIYRAGSLLSGAAAAVSGLFDRRGTRLHALSPAELEDIGLSVADLAPARKGLFEQLSETFGAGRAPRSNLPLGRSGSAGSHTTAEGTMYPGSNASRWARISRAAGREPFCATRSATRRPSPGAASRTATVATPTAGC